MSIRSYENFDLLLERLPSGRFRARVTSSPAGAAAMVDLDAPFDALERQNLMLRIDPGRSGMRSPVAEATDPARVLGGGLWDTVFRGNVRDAWEESRIHANASGHGLRMRLSLDEAPSLAALPWELLYDDDDRTYVAQSERTPIVRYLQTGRPLRPLTVHGPLSMLVIVSSPRDLPELDVEAEFAHVKDGLKEAEDAGHLSIRQLRPPTIHALGEFLRDNEVNVLHFIGHGDYLPARSEGVVYFTGDDGKSVPVGADVLGPYVHDHDPLRLVVLNACRTASSGDTDTHGGLAQGLVRRDIGAVVAMQFPISDGAATTFSRAFYGSISDGFPVDQAVTNARKALLVGHKSEWATPVLFLRAPDGVVFDPASLPGAEEQAAVATDEVEPMPLVLVPDEPAPAPTEPLELQGLTTAPEPTPVEPVAPTRKPRLGRGVLAGIAGGVAIAIALGAYVVDRLDREPTPGPSSPTLEGPALTGPALTAARFATAPTIDGDGAEWAGREAFTTSSVIVPQGGNASAASTWRLGWDADNYYVLAEVSDATITQTHGARPSQLFNGDGISFELGTDLRPTSTKVLPVGDVHVLYGPTPDGKVLRAMNVAREGTFEAGEDHKAGAAAARIVPGGYVLEISLPWSAVNVEKVDEGTVLATNLVLSDALASGDNKGKLKAMHTNNAARLTNAARFRTTWGTVTLTD